MRPHLEYWWIFGVRLAGSHYRAHDRGIQNKWNALLAFYKGKRPTLAEDLCDLLVEGGGRQKDLHDCQQPPSEAEYLIEKLVKPGGLIVDPYCGSGTIPAAAKKMGRAWLATEIKLDHVAIARKRLVVDMSKLQRFQRAAGEERMAAFGDVEPRMKAFLEECRSQRKRRWKRKMLLPRRGLVEIDNSGLVGANINPPLLGHELPVPVPACLDLVMVLLIFQFRGYVITGGAHA
jgi:hypothetical protein